MCDLPGEAARIMLGDSAWCALAGETMTSKYHLISSVT
jgi:hypothetical protein